MQKQYKIKVDITKKYTMPAFEVNTNDLKSIRLSIEVLNGASPLDLKDKTVRIAIRKPDNNIVFQDCTITDAANGQVEVILENQAYITPGTHTAEIMCYKGSDVVAVSGTFSYKSSKGIMNDEAVKSKSEFTAINRTIEEAERILEDLRENGGGVGVDEQARQGIQDVTKQLAEKATKDYVDTQVRTIPKGEKGDKGDPGTASVAIDDTVINTSQTWSAQKINEQLNNITPKNTTFFKTGKNLFNKKAATPGFYLRETDGKAVVSNGWNTSDYIEVTPDTAYTNGYAYRLAFYDANKTFISGLPFAGAIARTYTTPSNAKYVRFDVNDANIGSFQMEKGTQTTSYENYYQVIPNTQIEKHPFSVNDIPNKGIPKEKVGDEIATKIKAKNIVSNGNFTSMEGWAALRATGSVANNELTYTSSQNLGQYFNILGDVKLNHKYYVSANVKATSNQVKLHLYNGTSGATYISIDHPGNGQYARLSGVATINESNSRIRVIDYRSSGFDAISFKEFMVVDLTEVYGEGNEPTADEFETMVSGQNGGKIFIERELVTNLIDATLLKQSTGNSDNFLPVYVSYKNEILNTITKYNGNQDLRIQMQKRGPNNLFEFFGFYLIDNNKKYVSPSPSSGTSLFNVGTDFFAPYQLSAVNNINGDFTSGTHFTGGNHAFDGGSTGSPTARTASIQVFVDGRKVTDYSGYASFVDVYWSNRIQASNTKKTDGSGREVLQENIHLYYDGHKWHVDNTIEFLEDLKWGVYYGLQAQLNAYNGKIFYHNATNRKWNDAAIESNSGNKDCDKVTIYKGTNWLEVELELTGLGKKEFNTNHNHGAFVSSAGKFYFNLVNSGNTTLSAGDVFSFKGSYRFFSKVS